MDLLGLEFDEKFKSMFTTVGCAESECNCGKTHVAVESSNWEFDEEQLQSYIDRSNAGDKNIVLHDFDQYVELIELGGRFFVAGCECEGWKPYMEFILENRRRISNFLIHVGEEVTRATEEFKTYERLKSL